MSATQTPTRKAPVAQSTTAQPIPPTTPIPASTKPQPESQRTPSPPPEPPTTTSTLGPRAQALNDIFTTALSHTIASCSYPHFASCFPTPAKYNPALLESVWRQITSMIETRSRREFDEILIERDVVAGLAELERVVEVAKIDRANAGAGTGSNGPVHSSTIATAPATPTPSARALVTTGTATEEQGIWERPPQEIYLAHLAPQLAPIQEQMEAELRRIECDNEQLWGQIRDQGREAELIVSGLEKFVADLERANTALGGVVSVDGRGVELRMETSTLDAEIAGRAAGKR